MNNKTLLAPYLNFNGNTREAMQFYQRVLGGELELHTFEEFKMEMPDDYQDKIMHSMLTSGDMMMMAADCMPGTQVNFGDNVHLSISGSEEERLRKIFSQLSEDGKVIMPLARQVWGDEFGMLTDRYGNHWMVNINQGGQKDPA